MIYRFEDYELDLGAVDLRRGGARVAIEPQVFALLSLLIEERHRMVPKDEIVERVWDGRFISDSALSSRVKSARAAIADDGRQQRLIRTVHGKGFQFVGEVTLERQGPVSATASAPAEGAALPATGAAGRASIAVLPFQPLNADAASTVASAGLAHELIHALSKLRWLMVIARGTAFRFQSGRGEAGAAAGALGVRYELGGAILASGQTLTIIAELTDTEKGALVWSERFEGAAEEVHAVCRTIAERTCQAVELAIPRFEAASLGEVAAGGLDAWQACHLGLTHMYRFNPADNDRAAGYFAEALRLDPQLGRAHAGLSFTHFQRAFMHYDGVDPAREAEQARAASEAALAIDPDDSFANFTMGRSYWVAGDLEGSLGWLDRAIALNPNFAQGEYAAGWTRALLGDTETSKALIDKAVELSPLDPLMYGMLGARALGALAEGDDVAAADWGQKAARSPGAHPLISMIAAAGTHLAGNKAAAAAAAADASKRQPGVDRATFFAAFPFAGDDARARVDGALKTYGF